MPTPNVTALASADEIAIPDVQDVEEDAGADA